METKICGTVESRKCFNAVKQHVLAVKAPNGLAAHKERG
jgi:hypothetical protein